MHTKCIAASLLCVMLYSFSFAQDTTLVNREKGKKIILKIPGDTSANFTLEVRDNKVFINGKPMDIKDENELGLLNDLGNHGDFSIVLPPDYHGSYGKSFGSINNKAMLGVYTEKNEKGALITSVTKGSPAETAGLKKGDIITKVNGTTITDGESLFKEIGKYKPEEKVSISYLREGTEIKVNTQLARNKNKSTFLLNNNGDLNFRLPELKELNDNMTGNFNFRDFNSRKPRLGVQIQELETSDGIKITRVDEESIAAKAGLQENDIITELDGKEIKGIDDIREKLKAIQEGDTIKLKYKRDGKSHLAEIHFPKKLKTADL